MDEFQYGSASADDFIRNLAAASSGPPADLVVAAFNSFLEQPGLPLVEVVSQCGESGPNLSLRQSRYLPLGSAGSRDQQWVIPVCLRIGQADSETRTCLLLTAQEQSFELPQTCPDWIVPNADSAGYYRFAMEPDAWTRLLANGDRQNTNEMMAAIGSLTGAFNAGQLDVATLMSIVPQLIASPDWQVATAPIEQMNFMYDNMADAGQKQALEKRFTEYYAGKLSATGLETSDDVDRSRLQDALVGFMAKTAKQPELRLRLVDMARAWSGFGTDGAIHPEAANPVILGTALTVAVDELGKDFVDHLYHLVTGSTDAVVRGRALDAIGSTRDADIAAGVRELVFSAELRDNEIFSILYPQAKMPETRAATWLWFQHNIDRLLERIPADNWGRLTFFGNAFCDTREQAEVQAFFAGRIDTLTGGQRQLAQTLEGIELCVAKVQRHKTEMDTWLGL